MTKFPTGVSYFREVVTLRVKITSAAHVLPRDQGTTRPAARSPPPPEEGPREPEKRGSSPHGAYLGGAGPPGRPGRAAAPPDAAGPSEPGVPRGTAPGSRRGRRRRRRRRAQTSRAPLGLPPRSRSSCVPLRLRPGGSTTSPARPRAAARRSPCARLAARARRDGGRCRPERPPGARASRLPAALPAPGAAAATGLGPEGHRDPGHRVPRAVQVGGPPGLRLRSRCPGTRRAGLGAGALGEGLGSWSRFWPGLESSGPRGKVARTAGQDKRPGVVRAGGGARGKGRSASDRGPSPGHLWLSLSQEWLCVGTAGCRDPPG